MINFNGTIYILFLLFQSIFVSVLLYFLNYLFFILFYFLFLTYCLCAKSLPSCLTLCDPMDCSPPGSTVMGFSRQKYWNRLSCHPTVDLLLLLFCYFRGIFRGTHICTYTYAIYTRDIIYIYIHIYGKMSIKTYKIIMDTGILGLFCFIIALHRSVFFKLKICGNSASSKAIGTTFPTTFW